ncbi:MAG: cysteine--tRNA ligase [Alphaproteobacteria bacterium]|nr:cysteine--tRNA ligase [Alphaproteobacteria bacterium]
MPQPLRLYNTLTRTIEPFRPIEAGKVSLYVCGMTVYDRPHVGHGRAFVVFDAFVRYLRHRGWDVRFVRNFTDVDDKIIARANERGEDPLALAQGFIDVFHEDMRALGLIDPDVEPRVTLCIPQIIDLVQSLVDKGHAYASEGTVWFAVETCEGYGKLSGQDPDKLRNPDELAGKRAPGDFALWKAAKPGEPSWESPWGPGRPGWHIECSAMSRTELGETFDIHGGGLDLVFPHHENEIAQSECGNGAPYANYWMHNGLLTAPGGQKMGKSLGNVIDLSDALAQYPAEAIRLYYLQNQYRSPLPWSGSALDDALAMLARLYGALEVARTFGGDGDADRVAQEMGKPALTVLTLGRAFPEAMYAALDQDFNTALVLGHAFELARAVNRFSNLKKAKKRGAPVIAPALAAFDLLAKALGVLSASPDAFHAEVIDKRLAVLGVDPAEVERLIAERSEARAARDWARADGIRDALTAMHIEVMDRPDGVDWRVRLTPVEDDQ